MSTDKDNSEEFARRLLAPLRQAPPPDPHVMASIKENYLRQGASFHEAQEKIAISSNEPTTTSRGVSLNRGYFSWRKILTGAFLTLIILVGTSATVVGAKNSLPGEPLYAVKSLSEDIQLNLAPSPQTKLELTLDFAARRVVEISSMVEDGKSLSMETSERYKSELDDALFLAAQLDDTGIKDALEKIKDQAVDQRMTMEELIDILPEQAEPAITHLTQRLHEQVELSNIGEKDPQKYRITIRERQLEKNKNQSDPGNSSVNPTSSGNQDNPGQGNGQEGDPSSIAPGQDGSNPGNNDHTPNKTPKP